MRVTPTLRCLQTHILQTTLDERKENKCYNILFEQLLSQKFCHSFHTQKKQANLLPLGQELKCSSNTGEEILLYFTFFVLVRKLKGEKKKVCFRITANKSALSFTCSALSEQT